MPDLEQTIIREIATLLKVRLSNLCAENGRERFNV